MLHNTVHQSNNDKYFVIEDIDTNFIVISNVTINLGTLSCRKNLILNYMYNLS